MISVNSDLVKTGPFLDCVNYFTPSSYATRNLRILLQALKSGRCPSHLAGALVCTAVHIVAHSRAYTVVNPTHSFLFKFTKSFVNNKTTARSIMYAKTSIAALFGAFVAVSAQTTAPSSAAAAKATGPVISVLFPGTENQVLVGSIIGVGSALTTLAVACPSGTDSNDCGMPEGGMTVTQGPETVIMSTVEAVESGSPIMVNYGWACSLGGTTTAECVYSAVASVTGSVDPSILSEVSAQMTPQSSTLKLSGESLKSEVLHVTITAGAEKLSQTGSAEATGSESGSKTGSATATGTAATGSESGSKTGAASSPSGNPGAASNVKMGGFALGGALAAVFML